jgi:hypothetical protein
MTSAAEEVLNGMGHLSVKENENDILVSECRPIVCEIRHERTNR